MRSVRPLDAAIAVVAVLVIALAGFLGWSVIQHNASVKDSTAVSRAIDEIRAQVKSNPGSIKLRMDLAQAYAVAGREREATGQYLAVLKVSKNYIPALSGLGFLAAQSQDWPKSEQYWHRVLKLMDNIPAASASKQFETANFYMGTALLEQKKYEEAVGYFKASLRVNSSASDSHYLLAEAYKGLNDEAAYGSELEFALAFDPRMPEANYEYGLLMLKKGDEASAAEHFRTSVDRSEGRREPQIKLNELGPFSKRFDAAKQLAASDPKKAMKEARVAVALKPRDVDALLLLGQLQTKAKAKKDAAATYSRVLEIQPENPTALAATNQVSNDK